MDNLDAQSTVCAERIKVREEFNAKLVPESELDKVLAR